MYLVYKNITLSFIIYLKEQNLVNEGVINVKNKNRRN